MQNIIIKMEFLNRNKETLRIQKALSSEKSRLIIVYGRRRLGKTRLLQQLMEILLLKRVEID